jgi:3-dehydrosphinganine reductase
MKVGTALPTGHAMVTGGSSGIGLATACQLAAIGMDISIFARNVDRLTMAKAEIDSYRRSLAQHVLALSVDVSDRAQVDDAVGRAVCELGPPRLLVACAGVGITETFLDTPADYFTQCMAVNYMGSVYCVRALVPFMARAGGGHVVLVSSGAGLIGIYGYTAYSATKFALRGFGEALRAEVKPMGIRVSLVYPPDTDTPGFTAEERNKLPQTRKLTGAGGMLAADTVARAILRGIKAGRFAITPGVQMTLLHWLRGPFDPLLTWYLDRLAGIRWPSRAASAADPTP